MSTKKHSKLYITRIVIYWLSTAFIAYELSLGALWDFNIVNKGFVADFMHKLSYPLYFAYIMGIWKIPGAIILIIPGFLRLKEWAYAGAFFIYTGAAASNAFNSDWTMTIVAGCIAGVALLSYFLRPPFRKLSAKGEGASS